MTTVLTPQNRNIAVIDNTGGFLLKQDTFYLLLQDGSKIILNTSGRGQSMKYTPTLTPQTRN